MEASWAPMCWLIVQYGADARETRLLLLHFCSVTHLKSFFCAWRLAILLEVARNVKAKPQNYLDAQLLVSLNWWLFDVLFSEWWGFCVWWFLGGFYYVLVFSYIQVSKLALGCFYRSNLMHIPAKWGIYPSCLHSIWEEFFYYQLCSNKGHQTACLRCFLW